MSMKFRERGAALVVSLILLLIMTLLSLTAFQISKFEEKMAGNVRDKQMAFEAAEAALQDAEEYISTSVSVLGAFDGNGTDGLYDDTETDLWKKVDWSGTQGGDMKAITYSEFSGDDVYSNPQYVIELLTLQVTDDDDSLNMDGTVGNNFGGGTGRFFRVTARGVGGSEGAVVFLQSTFVKVL